MMYIQLIAGFILLLGGAEVLVRGAVALAKRLEISPLIIGMTVVALGTSAPELVVSLDAALSGSPGIALGNVVGSNIANLLLILGAVGIVMPIIAKSDGLWRDGLILLASSLLFTVLCWPGMIGLRSGILLLAAFAAFLGHSYWCETRNNGGAEMHAQEVAEIHGVPASLMMAWLILVAGLAGVIFGADLLVTGGVAMAKRWGFPRK